VEISHILESKDLKRSSKPPAGTELVGRGVGACVFVGSFLVGAGLVGSFLVGAGLVLFLVGAGAEVG